MRYLLLASFLFLGFASQGQIFNPVKWNTSYNQVGEDEFDLIITAKIDDGWVIYSQFLDGDDGPIPTSFHFDEGDHFSLIGKTEESGNKKEAFDKVFEMNLVKFSKTGIFTQRVKASDLSKAITGYLEFMTCDDVRCLPPAEVDFSFKLESKAAKPAEEQKETVPKNEEKEDAPKETAEKEVQVQPDPEEEVTAVVSTPKEEESIQEAAIKPPSGILDPVKWNAAAKQTGDNTYELAITGTLDKGWSIYSQFTEDNGPIPTAFLFDEGAHYERDGIVEESGNRKEGFDKIFEVNVIKYVDGAVTFTQKLKVNDPAVSVTGFLTYMACDDKQCLPPTDVPFSFTPADMKVLSGAEVDNSGSSGGATTALDFAGGFLKPDLDSPVSECGETVIKERKGMWSIFALGFIGGLIALLTPCVFPMIPLTVSFFTKSSKDKRKGIFNAAMYGFFILLVYLILSIPFHLMDSINPDILNEISTKPWLNILFFVIFVFFAFSFFGYYEITLPNSWANKSSSAEGIGGLLGIFFMALTLALVSFSCTGPILGSLLAGALSSDGGAWQLTAGMGGFGLALALPFALFAAFPSWLNSLPKSGGWLNTVKVVLGFLELALALKFLSNADLVKHWGILKIEPFLGLWILIFLGLGLYLFGLIKFPHDSPIKKLSWSRKILGSISLLFVVYLASGFAVDKELNTYRPLKLLSGLAPPAGYSWFYENDCPQNFNCFKDFEEGLAYAKEVNKPILVDFTGYACVNCRKMEEHVWPVKSVNKLIKEDFVLISLYVDDKRELPEEEKVEVEMANGQTRKLRNYGHKWASFQINYFETNAQPFYVLLSPDGKLLNNPVGYTPDPQAYAAFLECGLKAFK